MSEYHKIPLAFDALNIEKEIIDTLNEKFKTSWAAKVSDRTKLPIRKVTFNFDKREDITQENSVVRETYVGPGDIHVTLYVSRLDTKRTEDVAIIAYLNSVGLFNVIPVRDAIDKFIRFFGLNLSFDFPRTFVTFKSEDKLINKTITLEDLPLDEDGAEESLYDFFLTCKKEWVKKERL